MPDRRRVAGGRSAETSSRPVSRITGWDPLHVTVRRMAHTKGSRPPYLPPHPIAADPRYGRGRECSSWGIGAVVRPAINPEPPEISAAKEIAIPNLIIGESSPQDSSRAGYRPGSAGTGATHSRAHCPSLHARVGFRVTAFPLC